MNLSQFASLTRQRAKVIERRVNEIKIEVVTAGLYSLAQSTPVDEGVAVSNWQVGVGAAKTGVLPAYVPGEDQSTEAANRMAMLEAARNPLKTVKLGDAVHVTNNLDYIIDLDQGSSPQAPIGAMVPAALVTMRFRIRNAKIFNGVEK